MTGAVTLTRRQQSIYDHLLARDAAGDPPPTLDELCNRLGLRSRGSMHTHVKALIDTGLVEPMNGKQRGVRIRIPAEREPTQLALLGSIAAGRPIEAVEVPEQMDVPALCSLAAVSSIARNTANSTARGTSSDRSPVGSGSISYGRWTSSASSGGRTGRSASARGTCESAERNSA